MRKPLLIDDSKRGMCPWKMLGFILLFPLVLYIYQEHQIAEVSVGGKLPKVVLGTVALCGNVVAGQPKCNVDCAHGYELQCTWDQKCGGMCDVDYFLIANRLCPAPAPPPTAGEDLWHKATQSQCCTCTPNMGKAMSAAIEKQIEKGVEYPRMMPPINGRRPEFFDDGGDVVFAPPPPANYHPRPPPTAYQSELDYVDDTYIPKAPTGPRFYRDPNYMEPPWPMAPDGSQPMPPDILRSIQKPASPSPPTQPYESYHHVHHNAAVFAPDLPIKPIHPPTAPSKPLGYYIRKNKDSRDSSSILAHDVSVRGNNDVGSYEQTRDRSDGHEATRGSDATDEELRSAMNFVESLPDHV